MAPIVRVDLETLYDQSLYNYITWTQSCWHFHFMGKTRSQLTNIWSIDRELVKSFYDPDVSSVSRSWLLRAFISHISP